MNDLFDQGVLIDEKLTEKSFTYENEEYSFLELENIFRHKWDIHKHLTHSKIEQLSYLF